MKKKGYIILGLVLFATICFFVNNNFNSKENIENILKNDSYSYLPKQAKNYIKEVYEKTGKVILTEKNKEENKPYLNPGYVDFLILPDDKKLKMGNIPLSTVVDYSSTKYANNSSLPSVYNLNNVDGKNFVTPVRNQGELGLCWAFSSAGVVESHLLKKNNISYNNDSMLISERQMDYTTATDGIKDYKSEYVSFVDRNLGDGGNFYISTIAMANGVTLTDYNSFKAYNDKDKEQMELSEVLSFKKSLYEVDTTINMPILSMRESTSDLTEETKQIRKSYINEVKQNIMNYGAAYVGTNMNNNCSYYSSTLNNVLIDVYKCNKANGSHAMQIIGWDDNKEYSYCADDTNTHVENTTNCKNIVKGKGVWILKNSWGDKYPNPYLAYDSLESQISFVKTLNSSSDKTWDNNYILGDKGTITTKEYALSKTKIKKEEKLEKVKFITSSANKVYKVKIIGEDGSYKEFSKESEMPGLLTIDINDAVIDKNTKIIISSTGYYIDFVSFFTSNIDTTSYLGLEEYDNTEISEKQIRLYSQTKNIPSGTLITYKLLDKDNNDVTNAISYMNNEVAENNVNTTFDFGTLQSGIYKLEALYNDFVVGTVNIKYAKMKGSGTEADPYVITNSIQLDQIREDLDAYYVLGNDIDLTKDTREGGKFYNEAPWNLGGHGWNPIDNFSGTLDGRGHSIKGLYINAYLKNSEGWSRVNDYIGLFGNVIDDASIKNITLENFDITCHANCGTLFGVYKTTNYNERTTNFSNIIVKDSSIRRDSSTESSYVGGVFGGISGTSNSTLNISNIYSDVNIGLFSTQDVGALASMIDSFREINIRNIQLTGTMSEYHNDGLYTGILIHKILGHEINIENVFSTIYDEKIGANLINEVWVNDISDKVGTMSIKNVNMLKIPSGKLFRRNDNIDKVKFENVNFYDLGVNSNELSNHNNYKTWEGFNQNWEIKEINGITRYPILKGVNLDYTNISDIYINQELNKSYNIFDYVSPNKENTKRIIYKSNNEEIVKITDTGNIIPISTGNSTIHIESLYDGYFKDVKVNIVYKPHYTIHFDANGAEGNMKSVEVEEGKDYKLSSNQFYKEYYVFKEWNTKADGTGVSYSNSSIINAMEDKKEITLYAQWIGEEFEINFDPDGGFVSPSTKKVRYDDIYGELPIPIKAGYGFIGWNAKQNTTLVINNDNKVWYNLRDFKALWREGAYTIAYRPNGAEGYTNTSIGIFGEETTLQTNVFTKIGYVFKEWNTKPDGTGTSYKANDEINLSNIENSLLELYAQWQPIAYKVIYNANDGTGITEEQNVLYDEEVSLLENEFVNSGYKFKEWNTKSDGTGTSYKDKAKVKNLTIEESINLYAIWQEDFVYKINNYFADEENKYISRIMVNTTIDDYMKNIIVNENYNLDIGYKIIDDKKLLYTGSKTLITNDKDFRLEFTNIVIGDVNGDAEINSGDLLKVRQHLLKIQNLTNEYFISSDVNYDSEINSGDLLRIRQHLIGTIPIS